MSLKSLKSLGNTIGVRLTVWYSTLFILSGLVLFGLTYVLLASSLQRKDHESMLAKLRDLAAQYQVAGVEGLKQELAFQERLQQNSLFFIRFAAPSNTTLFVNIPDHWAEFDVHRLEPRAITGTEAWIRVPAEDDDQILEITSMRLPDGSLVQVGKSTEERDELLGQFGWIVAGIMIPMVGGGVIGGMFLALRALRPIRHLIETVRAIEAGTLGARVPTRQTGDELDELGRLFNTMLEHIAALIQGMRSALDDVAHDLRTPMTRLRGIAELALTTESDLATCREALADCVEEADRVRTLLNTLMDISEAETGTMALDLDVVHLSALLEDAVDLYREVAAEKGITVSTSAPRELCLCADRNRMRQVLANLLDNAIKYTSPGGTIDLRAYQRPQHTIIIVEDTGVGISAAEFPHIWDRLYRGDHRRSQRGLGLGLSVVKAVVQAHKGSVEVSSQPGVGSRFTLMLPMTASPAR
jgi:signal transduction histidine kinase